MALNSDDRAEISRMIDARMDERSVHQEARMFLIDEETRRTVARIDTRLDGIDGRLDGLERTVGGLDVRLGELELAVDGLSGLQRDTNQMVREILDRLADS